MKIRFLGQSGYILKSGNTEIITYPINSEDPLLFSKNIKGACYGV